MRTPARFAVETHYSPALQPSFVPLAASALRLSLLPSLPAASGAEFLRRDAGLFSEEASEM